MYPGGAVFRGWCRADPSAQGHAGSFLARPPGGSAHLIPTFQKHLGGSMPWARGRAGGEQCPTTPQWGARGAESLVAWGDKGGKMPRGYPLGRSGPGGQPPNQLPPGESVGVCLACVGMCIGCCKGTEGGKACWGQAADTSIVCWRVRGQPRKFRISKFNILSKFSW